MLLSNRIRVWDVSNMDEYVLNKYNITISSACERSLLWTNLSYTHYWTLRIDWLIYWCFTACQHMTILSNQIVRLAMKCIEHGREQPHTRHRVRNVKTMDIEQIWIHEQEISLSYRREISQPWIHISRKHSNFIISVCLHLEKKIV